MRASKETCERARQNFAYLMAKFDAAIPHDKQTSMMRNAATQVGEFLNATKRRLPTEAAYYRDSKRKAKAVC